MTVAAASRIKKYHSYFCSQHCLEHYEKILSDAKEKKLDRCCE